LVTCVALAIGPAANANASTFAPDSYVNRTLPDDAPLDPQSAVMVQRLKSQIDGLPNAPSHAWIGTTGYYDYGVPIYTVPAGQPTVKVTTPATNLQPQFNAVPLPPDAFPDAGTDGALALYQPSTDTLWEFWVLEKDAAGNFSARFGGRMTNVSSNPGWFEGGFGARATSLPMFSTVLRISELQAHAINHSIGFAMPKPAPCYRWPAQRQDGDLKNSDWLAPPMGSILRLPANLDIDAMSMPPLTKAIAKAVQKHGMVLDDRGGNVGFQAEDPRPVSPNPFAGPTGIFEGTSPSYLLTFFPWDKLQVLATPNGKSPCEHVNGTQYSVPPAP
jgi:hypothetical protein